MAETLTQRVKRLEEIVDVLLLVTAGHLAVARDPVEARLAVPAIRAYVDEPSQENYLAALAALQELFPLATRASAKTVEAT